MRRTGWLLLLGLAGCGPSVPPTASEPPPTATEPEETLVVYSLEPFRLDEEEKLEPGEVEFHRFIVIGSTTVADAKVRQDIVGAIKKGIEESDQDAFYPCAFMPRHGLRYTAKDGTGTDTIVCFACGIVHQTRNGQRVTWERNGP